MYTFHASGIVHKHVISYLFVETEKTTLASTSQLQNITYEQQPKYANTSVIYHNTTTKQHIGLKKPENTRNRRPLVYRPIGALSKALHHAYRDHQRPACYPHCHDNSSTTSPRRMRKHSSSKKKKNKHSKHDERNYKSSHRVLVSIHSTQ